jgi:hypothetical protein
VTNGSRFSPSLNGRNMTCMCHRANTFPQPPHWLVGQWLVGALERGTLLDMTNALQGDGPGEVVRWHAFRAEENIDDVIASGASMAMVATNDKFFGLARMYQTLRSALPHRVSTPEATQIGNAQPTPVLRRQFGVHQHPSIRQFRTSQDLYEPDD